MPEKRYLVTPGPTPVPPEVLAATALPMIHHRSADFRETFTRVLERLQAVYRTENDVLLFTSAGTAAMESAVANVCSPGDRVLVVSHGYFGERWATIAEGYGLDVRASPLRVGRAAERRRGRCAPRGDRAARRSCTSRTPTPRPAELPTSRRPSSGSRAPTRWWRWTRSRASPPFRSRPTSGDSTSCLPAHTRH